MESQKSWFLKNGVCVIEEHIKVGANKRGNQTRVIIDVCIFINFVLSR